MVNIKNPNKNITIDPTNPFQDAYLKVSDDEKYQYGPNGMLFHCSHSTMENAFRENMKDIPGGEDMLKQLSRYNGYDVIFDDNIESGKVFITTPQGNKYE